MKIKPIHLHIFFLSLIAVYIFSFHYLPLQDFPQWIYHGHVFNQMVFHVNNFGGYFSFHHYVPPNACATVMIGLFELMVSPIIAGKIFLLISVALIYIGSWRVLSVLTKSEHPLFAVIAFGSCFNMFFYGGFMNFLFGLGIALLGIAYILKKRNNSNLYVLSVIFLLCYLSHFATLLILLVPVLAVMLLDRDLKFMRRVSIALLPSVLLFIHYFFSKEIVTFISGSSDDPNFIERLWGAISHFPSAVMPFHRIKYILELPLVGNLLDYGFAILMISGVMLFVLTVIIKRDRSLLSIIGLLTTVLVIFSPSYLSGLFGLGLRFVYLLWLIMIAYYFLRYPATRAHTIETIAASLIALFSFSALWYGTALFNDLDIPSYKTEAAAHDPRGGSNPFEHFHYYDDIIQDRGVPVFHHALLDYPGAQNTKPFDQ